MTTDVKDVTICRVTSTTFTINCVFLEGSNESCRYTLLDEEGMDIAAGVIDRSNSEGETIALAGFNGGQFLAYDSNLMLGDDLTVRRNISSVNILECSHGGASGKCQFEILHMCPPVY